MPKTKEHKLTVPWYGMASTAIALLLKHEGYEHNYWPFMAMAIFFALLAIADLLLCIKGE